MSLVVEHILSWQKEEAMLRNQANRFAAASAWLIACTFSSLSFIVFAWICVSNAISIPHWEVYCLMAAAVVQFVFSVVALLKGLDELLRTKKDRRQSHGRRANDQ